MTSEVEFFPIFQLDTYFFYFPTMVIYFNKHIVHEDKNSPSKRISPKVSLLGVDSLWGDCTFILVDWGSL